MYSNLLESRWQQSGSSLCIGLDPHPARIQALGFANVLAFNRYIVDLTHTYALCYKPQIAHYSAYGLEAMLEQTIAHIRATDPRIPVILDGKRGDIGSTAAQYAREAYVRYGADAVTVNPYLGADGIAPFLEYGDKGVIVLAKTSNPSAGAFQNLVVDGEPFYWHVVRALEQQFPGQANLQYVVGATYPEDIARMRKYLPEKWFLVPGIGAQGGDLARVRTCGERLQGGGLAINATRAILYPEGGGDYAEAVLHAVRTLAAGCGMRLPERV
ncbi:MAG: orotidine-5'-phosphate decarboxylase [Cardiobacteriaceae bacterium]|nr:orotidine-5'-phosphate decarboxylase [Cardiobacteriaceae bacterium]